MIRAWTSPHAGGFHWNAHEMNLLEILDEAENGPTPGQLDGAPHLDLWMIVDFHNHLRAQGDVSGHPDISDPFVTTSPVIGFDAKAGWLRSRSRFYSLGTPLVLPGYTLLDPVPLDMAQKILANMRAAIRAEMN